MRTRKHRYVKAKALAERRRKLRIPRFRPRAKTRDTQLATTREVAKSPILPEGFSLYGELAQSAGGVLAMHRFFLR